PAQSNSDVVSRLRHQGVRLRLIKLHRHSAAAHQLLAEKDADALGSELDSGPPHRGENASPVGVSSRPRSFYQWRGGNRLRNARCFFNAARLFYVEADHVLHAFTVANNLLGKRCAYTV